MEPEILKIKGKDAKKFETYLTQKLTPHEKKSLKEADEFYKVQCE